MNLSEVKRREYSQAKILGIVSAVIQWALFGGSIYAIFEATGPLVSVLGVLAVVAPIIGFVLKQAASRYYSFGERVRRLLYLQDGLGRQPSPADLLELAESATSVPSLDPQPLDSEFTSELPKGPQRLAHITQEASFYTRAVARSASWFYGTLAVAGLAVTVVGLLLLVQGAPALGGVADPAKAWVKAASMLLVFFATGTFAERAASFHSLSGSAKSVFDKCELLRKAVGVPESDVLLAMGAYDAALAKAQPLPGWIYRIRRGRLHEAWKKFMASGTA